MRDRGRCEEEDTGGASMVEKKRQGRDEAGEDFTTRLHKDEDVNPRI